MPPLDEAISVLLQISFRSIHIVIYHAWHGSYFRILKPSAHDSINYGSMKKISRILYLTGLSLRHEPALLSTLLPCLKTTPAYSKRLNVFCFCILRHKMILASSLISPNITAG